jgi:transposase
MNYLAVDFHKNYSMATVIDPKGKVLQKIRLYNNRESFVELLRPYQKEVSAVVEACRNWSVAVDLLDGLVKEVTLAHPFKVRAIAEAKIKTDSIDSETLAQLLRADLIPQAYLRDKANQKRQRILRARSFYVKLKTQIKNRIHYMIDYQGEEIREGAKGFSDLFGRKGLEWLGSLELCDPDNKLLRGLLETYEVICQNIAETEWLIKEIIAEEGDCKLLKTIPGIGDFLSVLIKVEIGDISRFRTSAHLCSYAGLVSSTYSSGGKLWNGRITKQGNKWLRWAMVEAVVPAISSSAELRGYYEKIKIRKGSKVEKVATARRLLCIVYRVLNERDGFKEYKIRFKEEIERSRLQSRLVQQRAGTLR